jgi:hypothetical protein
MDDHPPADRLQRRLLAFRVYDLSCQATEKLDRAAELGFPTATATDVPEALLAWAREIADGQEFLPPPQKQV